MTASNSLTTPLTASEAEYRNGLAVATARRALSEMDTAATAGLKAFIAENALQAIISKLTR